MILAPCSSHAAANAADNASLLIVEYHITCCPLIAEGAADDEFLRQTYSSSM